MFHLDILVAPVAATLVLLLGRKLIHPVSSLKKYTMPESVADGLLVASALLILKKSMGWEANFDMPLRDPLMLTSFAATGLNANFVSLRAGGRVMGTFLTVVVGLLVMRSTIGIGIASLLGLDPLMGLLAGSITLSGGHDTGATWSRLFTERHGFTNVTEMAMACTTSGLVLGGLIGGPVARHLVKHSTIPSDTSDDQEAPTAFKEPDMGHIITSLALAETAALVAIYLTVEKIVAQLLVGIASELSIFVYILFTGMILNNGLSIMGFYHVSERAVSVLGNINLPLLLVMALMELKLWELVSLVLPMLAILVVQTIFMALYTIFVTWRMMGKNYDAAVLATDHCDSGLSVTSTTIANMQAITECLNPSHVAPLVVPMVGAFFINIANTLMIKLYLVLPVFTG